MLGYLQYSHEAESSSGNVYKVYRAMRDGMYMGEMYFCDTLEIINCHRRQMSGICHTDFSIADEAEAREWIMQYV